MLRRVLYVFAGVALAALLATDRAREARAAEGDIAGNWLLTYAPRGGADQALMIVKVETKDGKPTATVLYTPLKGPELTVSKVEADGKTVKFNTSLGFAFEGTVGKGGKVVGNFSNDQTSFRARLSRTDKSELAANEISAKVDAPAPAADAAKLANAVLALRSQAAREKDADKKKELLEKVDAAQKEADEKVPGLLREVASKHADSPFALDAAADLLRGGAKFKLTSDEAGKLLATVEKQAGEFGPKFSNFYVIGVVEALAAQKGLEGPAEAAAAKLATGAGATAAFRARALSARKAALEGLGKTEEAKAVATELAKLEDQIDAEYRLAVPPFKPTAFAGRKDKDANKVAVLELFTGAQCPPCVAADVAFDALLKSYKPTDLVLIQYHLHIPGPDPLTNDDTVARAKYYGANSTPSTFFNGAKAAAGGGGMANAESKFKQYVGVIEPIVEKATEVKVAGRATRTGDKIDIAVEVANAADLKLRVLVVEEDVKYVGGNQLRFHHQVVRAMPLGADGVAIKDKAFKQTTAVDLAGVKKNLTKYLDDFAANGRPFPKPDRPMEMKALKVIVLVQNDETKEIVQAAQLEVESKGAGQ
ncbi:MAG: hypothetical protein ACKODX_12825 [Gemmata sp.]